MWKPATTGTYIIRFSCRVFLQSSGTLSILPLQYYWLYELFSTAISLGTSLLFHYSSLDTQYVTVPYQPHYYYYTVKLKQSMRVAYHVSDVAVKGKAKGNCDWFNSRVRNRGLSQWDQTYCYPLTVQFHTCLFDFVSIRTYHFGHYKHFSRQEILNSVTTCN